MPATAPLLLFVLAMLLLAIFAAMLTAWGWLIWRLITRQPVLPKEPIVARHEPTWGFWSVLLIIVLYMVVGMTISTGYAFASRRGHSPQPKPAAIKADLAAGAWAKAADGKESEPTLSMTEMMFVNALAQCVMVLLVPVVLRCTSGARPRDIGFSWTGLWNQVAIGVVAILITIPVVTLIQIGAITIWRPNSHPLEKMLRENFTFDVAYLALVTAVILAPLLEEMLFRGILQSWLTQWMQNLRAAAKSLEPSVNQSDLTVSPGQPLVEILCTPPASPPRAAWEAIVLTSFFFALVHAAQWPAPLPIFVLSLILGAVYYRVGGLISSICMHAVFNGTSTLMMFVALLVGPVIDEQKILPEAIHQLVVRFEIVHECCVRALLPFQSF